MYTTKQQRPIRAAVGILTHSIYDKCIPKEKGKVVVIEKVFVRRTSEGLNVSIVPVDAVYLPDLSAIWKRDHRTSIEITRRSELRKISILLSKASTATYDQDIVVYTSFEQFKADFGKKVTVDIFVMFHPHEEDDDGEYLSLDAQYERLKEIAQTLHQLQVPFIVITSIRPLTTVGKICWEKLQSLPGAIVFRDVEDTEKMKDAIAQILKTGSPS